MIEEVEAVIEAFRRPGCSFLMPPAGTPLRAETVVDISHESLMRIWTRLRDWVDEETESAQTYRRLAETAELHSKRRARLWGDPDLTQALDWRERERPNDAWARRYHPGFTTAMAFLDDSDQVARQTRRRARTLTLGTLGISAAVAVVMFLLWARTERNLDQVQAFVDADRLDRLTRQCPLLFAPETMSPEGLKDSWVEPCRKALQAISELASRRRDHEKTLDVLKEKQELRGEILYRTVSRLVQDLNLLADARFVEPGPDEVEALKKLVEKLRSAGDPAKWQEAATAIEKNPRYGGFLLKPQVGLVPLGEDPASGLYEFANVRSGKVPERGSDGRLLITEDTAVVLVLIPGGKFLMGSGEFSSDEQPEHEVRLRPFFIAKHELTKSQLARLTGEHSADDGLRPANWMSFYDARQVAVALGLRLPTEAEWEYACRAGTRTRYHAGDTEADLARAGWYRENSDWQTHPVGQKEPNAWGLYDMHGNVWEWCQDWYDESYYKISPEEDPQGPETGSLRVIRGGGWDFGARFCRSAIRFSGPPDYRGDGVGFRLARSVALGP